MLESWIFHETNVLIRTIKLIFLISNLHCKGLKRSIRDVGAKKGHYLMFQKVKKEEHEEDLHHEVETLAIKNEKTNLQKTIMKIN